MSSAVLDDRQLRFPFAPGRTAIRARPAKPAPLRVEGLTVAEMLNRGVKVEFLSEKRQRHPRDFRSKSAVILKADADTLKGAGVATTVEFGTVKYDSRGHPIRKGFEVLPAAKDTNWFGGELVLSRK